MTLSHSCRPSRRRSSTEEAPQATSEVPAHGPVSRPKAGGRRPEGHRGAARAVEAARAHHSSGVRVRAGGLLGHPGQARAGAEPGFRESKRERARSRSARSIAGAALVSFPGVMATPPPELSERPRSPLVSINSLKPSCGTNGQ